MRGKALGLTAEWESINGDGEGRFFDCDWDYNSQESVEDFSMSEVVCLVSRVVMSRLLFWFCIELGGHLSGHVPTVCNTMLKRLWGTLRA